ncbi:MAG: diaminopimelate decarboxylase [Planctomycetes bacterium]|nr:diaminopimelate decarboxylase [Planctomycetota bacterium]
MDYFRYVDGRLLCEDLQIEELAARHGTPLYIYSRRTIVEHFQRIREAFAGVETLVCYSVKANSNLALLSAMRREGAGFDVVSGGELFRALRAGADPARCVFAGVGKTDEEIEYALERRIFLFNVESWAELENIDRLAAARKTTAQIALRLNPDVDPSTHTYITTGKKENKFGVDLELAVHILDRWKELSAVRLVGIHLHIGSQILKVEPYVDALAKVKGFLAACRARGHALAWIDMGGGFGIFYKDRDARPAREFADAVVPLVKGYGCGLILEPGRFIVGNAGILVTRVLYLKESGKKKFVICDAGMNDLIRPTLYSAYHRIWPVRTEPQVSGPAPDESTWKGPSHVTDVVGPVCESGDFFAKDRSLPPVGRGDLLAVFSAGAYGFSMASNYNSRPRPAELLVSGGEALLATERETYEDLVRRERTN